MYKIEELKALMVGNESVLNCIFFELSDSEHRTENKYMFVDS